jgi:hypothetical protein
MNIVQSVVLETNRSGRYIFLSVPVGVSYDEALDAIQEMSAAVQDMKDKDPRSKPVEEPEVKAELV